MNLLSFFSPYKLLIEAIAIGALILGIAFGIHKFLAYEQDIGYQRGVAEATAKELLRTKALVEKIAAQDKIISEANNHGQEREQAIKTLSSAVGVASLGLRDAAEAIRRGASTATIDALRQSTTALATVFTDCQKRYGDLATVADRHASDVKTLQEAWPK